MSGARYEHVFRADAHHSVLIIGLPADLYVCSDEAAEPDSHVWPVDPWLRSSTGAEVVTGSSTERVPLSDEAAAEIGWSGLWPLPESETDVAMFAAYLRGLR